MKLLLLDNASAHTAHDMKLESVKLLFLPSNTISKLQSMNAGIIASLMRRYRHLQLDHALYMEKQGLKTIIYTLDQLTAMNWI